MALPDQNKQVLTISDFTPGIYSNGNYATNVPPAPLGAAQEANTYRCIGLPGGGLAPLPKRAANKTIPWPSSGTTGTIVGLQTIYGGDWTVGTFPSTREESVFVIIDTDSATRAVFCRQYNTNTDTWTSVQFADVSWPPVDATGVNSVSTQANTKPPLGVSSDIYSRLDSGVKQRGIIFCIPWAPRHVYFTAQSAILQRYDSGFAGSVVFHQGRVVMPIITAGNLGGGVARIPFEYLEYTLVDLADSLGVAGYGAILYYDRAQCIGAFGSISVGELFLIPLNNDDALIISGDLDNPTITPLRGVQPTGFLPNKAIQTDIGLLYCSEKAGVWLWNGSNRSVKISEQLRDDFFERATNTGGYATGEAVHPAKWGNYILYPNNFLLDTRTQSWWRLENPSDKTFAIWTSHWPMTLWGAVDSIQSGTTNSLSRFDLNTPALSYSWQSQPIQVSQYGETVRVTDIEVKAVPSVADTNQTITVTLTNRDNTTVTETITINSKTTIPVRERVPTVMRGDDIIVRIEADGGANPAPVIHSISLVWDAGTPTA